MDGKSSTRTEYVCLPDLVRLVVTKGNFIVIWILAAYSRYTYLNVLAKVFKSIYYIQESSQKHFSP